MNSTSRTIVYLGAAVVAGLVAVGWPLDGLADASFAWHMVQHLLLLFVLPLFVLLSAPFASVARYLGKAQTAALVRRTRPLHVMGSPPVALAAFTGTLWMTHFSGLYESALRLQGVHLLEHAAYVTAGILFWLPVLGPAPLRPLPYASRLLYLAIALPQGALLSVAIYAARVPLYAHYAQSSSIPAALADQHDAAALLWILGGTIVLITLLVTLGVWARREREVARAYEWPLGGGRAATSTGRNLQ